MFICIDCEYQSNTFDGDVAGRDSGAFTYRAMCPQCKSAKVNVIGAENKIIIRLVGESKPETVKKPPPIIYAHAWDELYKLYGERLDQESLALMDAVFAGVVADMLDEIRMFNIEEIFRRFPHLDRRE